jgi:hypothetical protein
MTDYKPGDRVTLLHDDGSRLEDREVDSVYSVLVGKRREYVNDLTATGWRIASICRAVEPLPTGPGAYADANGTHWVFDGEDWWVGYTEHHGLDSGPSGPLVPLVPEPFAREKAIRDVLKYIDDFGWKPGQVRIFEYGHAARILEHFGYAP